MCATLSVDVCGQICYIILNTAWELNRTTCSGGGVVLLCGF